jgi:AcrR family transcriptional regulator
MSVPSRPRRTQDERSAAMRARLLDATVECLDEYGYAGTTVTRIAERAGVTRGAQVHHYRTKADLVIAAVSYLAGQSAEVGASMIEQAVRADDAVGALLDLLWEMHQGPTFTAAVELWVAARTDPELREHVAGVEPLLMSSLRDAADSGGLGNVASIAGVDPALRDAVFTAMDAMRGLLISAWHLPARQRSARWHRARENLRALFPPPDQVRAAVVRVSSHQD